MLKSVKEIKVVENQDGQMVVSSREVAKNFEKQHSEILKRIQGYDRDGIHTNGLLDDFQPSVNTLGYIIPHSYKDSKGEIRKEYLLTRDGFSLLVMGFTGSKALEWKLKYIDAFNEMEAKLRDAHKKTPAEMLLEQAQFMVDLERKQLAIEKEQEKIKDELTQTNTKMSSVDSKVDSIKEVVSLNSDNWRKDAKSIIAKIALAQGGYDQIPEVNRTIYAQLDKRMGVNVKQRQMNKCNRMLGEGVSMSDAKKVSVVDTIADDKKLVEGYLAIVKEMAIKYGVGKMD